MEKSESGNPNFPELDEPLISFQKPAIDQVVAPFQIGAKSSFDSTST